MKNKRTISARIDAKTLSDFDKFVADRRYKNRAFTIERLMAFCLALGSTGKSLALGHLPLTESNFRDAFNEFKARQTK